MLGHRLRRTGLAALVFAFCIGWGGGVAAEDGVLSAFSVAGKDFRCEFEPQTSRLECKASSGKSLKRSEVMMLEDPDRLVLDIPDVVFGKPQSYLVNASEVIRMRCAQRDTSARLVLDLRRPVTFVRYDSEEGQSVLSLDLSPSVSEVAPPASSEQQETGAPDSKEGVPSPLPETRDTEEDQKVATPSAVAPRLPAVNLSIPRKSLEPEAVLLFSVSSTFLSFEPGDRPVKDIQVVNKTEKELFLRSDVQRVYDSGTPAERYENTKVIVASPKRFALPPLATRALRLVVSGSLPESGEEIYRVILSPEESPDAQVQVVGEVNQQAARFKVVAGLGVTVALPSAGAQGNVRIEPQVNQVVLINTGTRSVLVENCAACPLNRDSCVSSGRKLLYPQRPWSLPVAGSGVINCDVMIGNERNQLSSLYNSKESK